MTTERECTKSKEEPLAWDHVIIRGKQQQVFSMHRFSEILFEASASFFLANNSSIKTITQTLAPWQAVDHKTSRS